MIYRHWPFALSFPGELWLIDEAEKARRLAGQELKQLAWEKTDLIQHRRGHLKKSEIVLRWGWETAMTLAWIAQADTRNDIGMLFYAMNDRATARSSYGHSMALEPSQANGTSRS